MVFVTIDKNNKLTKTQTDLDQQYCLYAAHDNSLCRYFSVVMFDRAVIEKAQTVMDGRNRLTVVTVLENLLRFCGVP